MRNAMILISVAGLLGVAASMLIAPFIIRVMTRIKAGQPILKYLEHHGQKNGTPTMGGLIFIIPAAVVPLCLGYGRLSFIAVLATLGYGTIGFLDDYTKVRYKRNEGLKPYQKIIGQLGIAVIISFFAYKNEWIGDSVKLPFSQSELSLGVFYIPFSIFMFLAVTNSANLADGLDGLSGGVGFVSMTVLLIGAILYCVEATRYGMTGLAAELYALCIFAAAYAGSLLGFLWNNSHPAR
ncbi:MAG: phospho-N-acetylmuramoyl-pentapeptide-transferase, partial [Clostridiales bacterium]|nr:phospho-N-acetylmuramoyl-pentapeptide-transferase [Clostridiales bacterium]